MCELSPACLPACLSVCVCMYVCMYVFSRQEESRGREVRESWVLRLWTSCSGCCWVGIWHDGGFTVDYIIIIAW